MPWTELDSEVARQVQDGGFGGTVRIRRVGAKRADVDTCYRACDNNTGGVFEGSALLEQRCESNEQLASASAASAWFFERENANLLLDTVENTLDIKIHDLTERIRWVRVEARAPRSTRVGKEYVYMVGVLLHLFDQALDLGDFGAISGYTDGLCARLAVREGV